MPLSTTNSTGRPPESQGGAKDFQFYFFTELIKRPICSGKVKNRLGKLTDLVFRMVEPFPEAVGIFVDHGWGKPNEFIPWEKVVKIEDDAIFVQPTESDAPYPSFVDQKGWILLNEHLMGKTIYDIDGRRTEVVNDVHLIASIGKMLIAHVDISFNGFFRKWGLARLTWIKNQFIPWKYVQPFSLEDTGVPDSLSLSITRKHIKELPGEDLADVLEELTGNEQQAVFSSLDSEKAAEALIEAEPRAQRQLIANLRKEKARTILSEMSIPQLAALFSVLPHDQMTAMMNILPADDAKKIDSILHDQEIAASALMSSDFVTFTKETKIGTVLEDIRASQRENSSITYIYIVGDNLQLIGVVDIRDLILTNHDTTLGTIMASPVVSIQSDDLREDLAEMFAKYHYRMIPVVDELDHILGVIHYNDIMKGLVTRATV
ncbi:MAG: magnesium transporter MgtE N-terminal domain-containing protein [Bacteroidota bacterium]